MIVLNLILILLEDGGLWYCRCTPSLPYVRVTGGVVVLVDISPGVVHERSTSRRKCL
jgi:hypothetical protein